MAQQDFSHLTEDDGDVGPSDQQLKSVSKLAERQVELDRQVRELEEQLAERKKELNQVKQADLPEAMAEAGLSSFTTNSGRKIEIKEKVEAGIPSRTAIEKAKGERKRELAERKRAALDWLRANGRDSIIKNQLTVDVGKGQDNAVSRVEELLQEIGMQYQRDEAVHPQTLQKLIRELREEGEDVPEETFGVRDVRYAEIKG